MQTNKNFAFPAALRACIRKMLIFYETENEPLLHEVLSHAAIKLDLGRNYHDYQDSYGHVAVLYVPEAIFRKLGTFDEHMKLAERLSKDFNKCTHTLQDESIDDVSFEIYDAVDPECLSAIPPLSKQPLFVDETLQTIWEEGYIRIFLSHKSSHKAAASALAKNLAPHGISCFVAHEQIEGTAKWLQEINKALFSMDIFLAFLTDDFADSQWTDQEVGIAYARQVPIIPLKMQDLNPYGFIADIHAVRGALDDETLTANEVLKIIAKKLDKDGKMRMSAVASFINSPNFDEVKRRFIRLQTHKDFTEEEIERLVATFNTNDQLASAYYLTARDRFLNFINRNSQIEYVKLDNKISQKPAKRVAKAVTELDDEIPF